MAKFKDLAIGDTFDFIEDGSIYNSFYDRCRKVSARKYVGINNGQDYRVGSTSCDVHHVEKPDGTENEFSVIEYHSFYAVRHNPTGAEHPMGDGVDQSERFDIGTEDFRRQWEENLNANPVETREAYFPDVAE